MSFFNLMPVVKKPKKIVIYEDDRGKQWLGDSCSAYRLYDIPFRVDGDNILDMMGISDAQRKKFETFEKRLPGVWLGDYGEPVEWMVPFIYYNDLYQVIRSGDSVICVLEHYLRPLKSFDKKEYRIEECDGLKYLVVNVGAMPLAVIAGEPVGEEMLQRLNMTVKCLERIAVPGEPKLFDEETGEVKNG